MCKVGDHLLCVIEKLIATPSLFLSQIYMMSLFLRFMDELPPFEEYMRTLFDKQMLVVDKTTGLRVNHMRAARDELFHPTNSTSKECTPRMLEVVAKGMTRWRDEMLNKKKGTYANLSVSRAQGS